MSFLFLKAWPWQLLRHFLWTLGPQKTRFEINAPNHLTSYITESIYIRNHLQWQLFSGSSSDSPRGAEFSICLCWLMFPLLSSMKMSSYNASHLTFLSPSHFKDGPIEVSHPHDLDSPWLNSHSCKNVLRLHTSAWWPDVYHQFTWQLELLLLGLHFTHLQFSLSFSDKPRFLPTLAFFSDNVFLWQPHWRQVKLSTFQLWYCLWLSNRCLSL